MTSYPDETDCPTCGHIMKRDIRPDVVEYKGRSQPIMQPGWYCTHCEEILFCREDILEADAIFIQMRAEVEGVLTPAEVKAIRVKLKLSQRQAGTLLGGGPRAFQKYESSEVMPSRAVSNLLRLLDHDPSLLRVLEAVPTAEAADPDRDEPPRAASF